MKKIVPITTAFVFFLFIPLFSTPTYAFDLINFIAKPDFPEHTLSFDEKVSYTSEGGVGPGQPVRQKKNNNYEQFFVGAAGIYRREDTSWAPNNADAVCEDNDARAAYTLDAGVCTAYTEGSIVSQNSGALWAPAIGSNVGDTWTQEAHQIVTIDTTALPALEYCKLKKPAGTYDYPKTCGSQPSLTITGYYPANTYTFCSGVKNPAPVVTISGTAGAGQGDGFAYMEGCGLVGFTDANSRTGITSGCGITGVDKNSPNFTCFGGGGVGAGQCEVLSEGGSSFFDTVAGIFSSLLSSVANALAKNPDIECTHALENLSALNPADRARYIKRPVDCDAPEVVEGVTYVAEFKHNFSWFGSIVSILFGDEERGSRYEGPVYNLVADTSSGIAAEQDLLERNNLRDYYCGADCDAKIKEEVLNCAVTDTCADYKAYNYAGPIDKLSFRESKNINGEWKKTRDARRDEVLCQVVSGYTKAMFGKVPLDPSFEVTAGYIHRIPGSNATWVTAIPFTDVSRPLYGIEFVCTNSSFTCPGLSRDDINSVCEVVMGPQYGSGVISPGSYLFANQLLTLEQAALTTPSELCLYGSKRLGGCAAFHLLPEAVNQDKAGVIAEHVQKGAFDPDTLDTGEENETFRERPFSLPNGVKPLAERVFAVFASPEQKKAAADPKPQLQTQCKNTYGVAGEVPAAFGGKVENKRYRFGFSPPQPQVGGLTISRGQVLQAADPIPSPSPNSHTETRTYVTTVKLPQDIVRTQAMISGSTGYCTQLLPYDVARQMRTPVDGTVSPREFPQRADLAYTSTAISGDSAAPIPLLGGVLIAADKKNGICSELILPYSPNKQASTSRTIYALTKDKIAQEELAQDPFARLASFQALEQTVALRQISDDGGRMTED